MPAGIGAPLVMALSAASAATGIAGALGAFGKPKVPTLPPTPNFAATTDQDAAQANAQQLQQEQQRAGLQSTIGTPTAAGATPQPSTMSSKQLQGQ